MITVKIDTSEVEAMLGDLKHKMPSAIARGLTFAAYDARDAAKTQMPKHLDRPTPWTMRSLFVFPAEKKQLESLVAFKNESGSYRSRDSAELANAPMAMRMSILGGQRTLKASEKSLMQVLGMNRSRAFLVPQPRVPRDRYGNVTGGYMNRVLYKGIAQGSASMGNTTPISGRRARKTTSPYFIMRDKQGQPMGIFERIGRAIIEPLFYLSARGRYKPRFDFYGIAEREINRTLNRRIRESIDVIIAKYR